MNVLCEIINVGAGQGASILNTMLQTQIDLKVSRIQYLSKEIFPAVPAEFSDSTTTVTMQFSGPLAGSSSLVFPAVSTGKLLSGLTGADPELVDLDSLQASTISEIGNIVLNGIMGSISNILNIDLTYCVPEYSEGSLKNSLGFLMSDSQAHKGATIVAKAHFEIENLQINSDVILFFEVDSFKTMAGLIDDVILVRG